MENTYHYTDSSNEQHDVVFDAHSFELTQKTKIINDKSLVTKPTSFLKDALRRFCKSKASIVGAIILGIIVLLSLILPVALPFDTTGKTTLGTQYLPPKLFPAGTGFWDGTKEYKDLVYNPETNLPDGSFDTSSIVEGSLKTYAGTLDNTPNKYAKGGYIRIASADKDEFVWSNGLANIDNSKSLSLSYDINANVLDNYEAASFYISLVDQEGNETFLVNDSTEYGKKENIDVTNKVADNSHLSNVSLHIGIHGSGNNEDKMIGIFASSVSLYNGGSKIDALSFDDANGALLNNTFRKNSSNLSGLTKAEITYCSFTYDPYLAAYGEYTKVYSEQDMQKLIDQGLLKYDVSKGVDSFEILDDLCPVIEVVEQKSNKVAGIVVTEITVKLSKYKEKGFASMPLHLFGTDANGVDMLKYVFEGTRNSLGLAIIISAICFIFGLIYGAIEGYFGGTTDLLMERFVDILSNIPSIILITIFVLHWGQTFSVFMLAMCLTGWIGTAGLTRTQFYRFKRREYVLASRSLGASDGRLIFHHILPNSMGTIVTSSVLMIPNVIYAEATISYLGIGLSGQSSLGNILSTNQANISTNQYLLIFPSVIIAVILICFNLFGNGLRDALNPSLKGSD